MQELSPLIHLFFLISRLYLSWHVVESDFSETALLTWSAEEPCRGKRVSNKDIKDVMWCPQQDMSTTGILSRHPRYIRRPSKISSDSRSCLQKGTKLVGNVLFPKFHFSEATIIGLPLKKDWSLSFPRSDTDSFNHSSCPFQTIKGTVQKEL